LESTELGRLEDAHAGENQGDPSVIRRAAGPLLGEHLWRKRHHAELGHEHVQERGLAPLGRMCERIERRFQKSELLVRAALAEHALGEYQRELPIEALRT